MPNTMEVKITNDLGQTMWFTEEQLLKMHDSYHL